MIVLGELFAGFEQGKHTLKNVAELEEFLSTPVVEVLPVDRLTAEIFGKLVADLRRRGRPIPVNDIWIAATCARAGATEHLPPRSRPEARRTRSYCRFSVTTRHKGLLFSAASCTKSWVGFEGS